LRAGVDRKISSTLHDYREDKAVGLSFLPVHMKKKKEKCKNSRKQGEIFRHIMFSS
jgi:hypothetical protein